MSKRTRHPLLTQLSAAVLALPAIQSTQAQQIPGDHSLSYRISQYDEDRLPTEAVVDGAADRYEIEIHQLRFATDLSTTQTLTFDATRESMSGSTPWFFFPDAQGDPQLIMSGATITDERTELVAGYSTLREAHRLSASLGASQEDDYKSWFASVGQEVTINRQQTTLGYGVSISDDRIEPTDALAFDRIQQASRHQLGLSLTATQVLNPRSIVQTSLQYKRHQGYLSDPYKRVFVAGQVIRDQRPDRRRQWTLATRYRHFFPEQDAALHADYRYYRDDWSVQSHTVDLSWHQSLGNHWSVVPGLRYYSQSEAEFYAPVHLTSRSDGHHSADYRLSGYGALSGLFSISRAWKYWKATLSVEVYRSDEDFGHDHSRPDSVALVDFQRVTLGFDTTW